MEDFKASFRHWQCVVFSVLSSVIMITALLILSKDPFSLTFFLVAFLLIGFSSAYFFLGRCSHFPERIRYLIRVIPVLFLVMIIAGFLLSGFLVYLFSSPEPLQMTSEDNALDDLPRLAALPFVILGLLLPLLVVFASRDVWLTVKAHHHVDRVSIRFFTRKKEWTVYFDEYNALVIGENIVLGCKDESDIADAIDFVNSPLKQPLLHHPLDGVYYIATEDLQKDLISHGYVIDEEKRAVVVLLTI